jgi:hypothetical protein
MPRLTTHKDFQRVRFPSFCYLCGRSFADTPGEERDSDHVPPKKIFAASDRDRPLILEVHKQCHKDASEWDELTNEFASLPHDKARKRNIVQKHVEAVRIGDEISAALTGVPLNKVIARFLRAFHTALYDAYLPNKTDNAILPPFPSGNRKSDGIEFDPILPQFYDASLILKKSRIAGRIDEIRCFNDRCHYFCVWSENVQGPCCLFALRIHDWEQLADMANFPHRACMGIYSTGSIPQNATRETPIIVHVANRYPLDPFAD